MIRRALVLSAALPVLGLVALVARAEIEVRRGTEWLIGIEGFDPRDLLSGRYLRYQHAFRWEGEATCGEREARLAEPFHAPSPGGVTRSPPPPDAIGCCVCLTQAGPGLVEPRARLASCEEAAACEGSIPVEQVVGARKYFVPEARAAELEEALRQREAAVILSIRPGGTPAVGELYLDGRPFREALGR